MPVKSRLPSLGVFGTSLYNTCTSMFGIHRVIWLSMFQNKTFEECFGSTLLLLLCFIFSRSLPGSKIKGYPTNAAAIEEQMNVFQEAKMNEDDVQKMTNKMKTISDTVENETMEITTDFTRFYDARMPVKSPSYMSMSLGNPGLIPETNSRPEFTSPSTPAQTQGEAIQNPSEGDFEFPETSLEAIPAFDPRIGVKTGNLKSLNQGSTSPGYKDVFNFSLPVEPRYLLNIVTQYSYPYISLQTDVEEL